jgi:hypothetical protein
MFLPVYLVFFKENVLMLQICSRRLTFSMTDHFHKSSHKSHNHVYDDNILEKKCMNYTVKYIFN